MEHRQVGSMRLRDTNVLHLVEAQWGKQHLLLVRILRKPLDVGSRVKGTRVDLEQQAPLRLATAGRIPVRDGAVGGRSAKDKLCAAAWSAALRLSPEHVGQATVRKPSVDDRVPRLKFRQPHDSARGDVNRGLVRIATELLEVTGADLLARVVADDPPDRSIYLPVHWPEVEPKGDELVPLQWRDADHPQSLIHPAPLGLVLLQRLCDSRRTARGTHIAPLSGPFGDAARIQPGSRGHGDKVPLYPRRCPRAIVGSLEDDVGVGSAAVLRGHRLPYLTRGRGAQRFTCTVRGLRTAWPRLGRASR
eukprot:scaffold246758_cov27-Tisochrysis_lutea.AAC.2